MLSRLQGKEPVADQIQATGFISQSNRQGSPGADGIIENRQFIIGQAKFVTWPSGQCQSDSLKSGTGASQAEESIQNRRQDGARKNEQDKEGTGTQTGTWQELRQASTRAEEGIGTGTRYRHWK